MKPTALLFLTLALATSCSSDLRLSDYYDADEPFQINDIQNNTNGIDSDPVIEVGDPRHQQLLAWLDANSQNWEPSHDRHAGLVIIKQGNVKLLLNRNVDLAVVIVSDENGNKQYYKKTINKASLVFLKE